MTASAWRAAVSAVALMAACTGSAAAFSWPWSDSDTKKDAPPPPPAYSDTSLPFEKRVDDLVGRLTLEEKASQLGNWSRPIPRLGVPGYNWWSEALHGVARNGVATVFPQAIALGATFDPAAVHAMGVAISTEARVKYNEIGYDKDHGIYQGLSFWSPNVNIFRDPRWGRGQETYGEDPWLTGQFGKAFVEGMQGDDPKYLRTIATPKHFAVHSGPESTRHGANVPASKHDMMDTYLPQFRTAIVEGNAQSVMCAYNSINGQPACAQEFLLRDILRNAWKFKGVVVSDCDAIQDIAEGHKYTKTVAEAAAASLKLGVDNDCSTWGLNIKGDADYQRYIEAMKQGLVSQQVVDETLKRLFLARMKLGMFDPKNMVKYAQVSDSELNSPAHSALALKLARESMVLLKNNGALPLKQTVKRIAVVGPLADQIVPLYGNYNGTPLHAVSALEGLKKAFPNAEIVFEPGTSFLVSGNAIPASVLKTPDGKPGLLAEFFENDDFSGTPVLRRIDAGIDYERGRVGIEAAELPKLPHFAVRWTGTLTPDKTGEYAIGLDARIGKLWLDGKEIVNVGSGDQASKTVAMHLEAGKSYSVKVERGDDPRMSIHLVWSQQTKDAEARAVAAAKKADVVVAVVGITPQLEGEEMKVDVPGFAGGDKTTLDMPAPEEKLLKAVRKATKKPLVTVLYNGSALSVNWAAKQSDAILEAWYGGQAAGTAIADILSGTYNPSGRLPVTFYAGLKDLPAFEDYSMANRTYRYYAGKPLYPFGHGLSYTSFGYGTPKLTAATVKAGEKLGVDVEVKNTGKIAGDEVAQLYLTFPGAPGMPRVAMRGLARVSLAPGETKSVHFDLSPRDLSSVTPEGVIKVQPGAYKLSVGGGQPGATKAIATVPFAIEGETVLAD
ncbi:beta-glucosidase [Rhizomicrobium palustre]|uniref:Beta-glucosidase n=1 Tax=Rhizomicrobium palustre TaxID=189966 RepID=A0A846N1T9_9PROT|nr:glycoside hydrolase family 3 C-terminal domain-containing protein [Rhizomicrobium palustre]NIK89080.1 beta-glucosidase [Rhizomicrobium palustre]